MFFRVPRIYAGHATWYGIWQQCGMFGRVPAYTLAHAQILKIGIGTHAPNLEAHARTDEDTDVR